MQRVKTSVQPLHRSARAARMLSDAVEANNRYVTLISAVQLSLPPLKSPTTTLAPET